MNLSKIIAEEPITNKMLSKQKAQFRAELQQALSQDGGMQDGELGPAAQELVDRWMEDPRNVLDAEAIEFIIDDLTLFSDVEDENLP